MEVNHSADLLSSLKEHFCDPSLADVKIFVGKECQLFSTNSFLLATRSPVFKAMFFTSGLKEQQTKELKLPQTNPLIFSQFLNYVGTGELQLTEQVNNNKKKSLL